MDLIFLQGEHKTTSEAGRPADQRGGGRRVIRGQARGKTPTLREGKDGNGRGVLRGGTKGL